MCTSYVDARNIILRNTQPYTMSNTSIHPITNMWPQFHLRLERFRIWIINTNHICLHRRYSRDLCKLLRSNDLCKMAPWISMHSRIVVTHSNFNNLNVVFISYETNFGLSNWRTETGHKLQNKESSGMVRPKSSWIELHLKMWLLNPYALLHPFSPVCYTFTSVYKRNGWIQHHAGRLPRQE